MARLPDHLTTPRLVLRRWQPADVDALATAIAESREHLLPWMPWAAAEPLARETRLAWIDLGNADAASGGDAVLGMFAGPVVVGGTGLHRRRGPDTLEIGYWVHADHLGQGFATEAATALTTAAFAVPGIEHVEIHHDRANTASRGIPERLGYRMVAESPDAVTAPGEEGVDCCWRTDRRGWPPSAIARARHSPR